MFPCKDNFINQIIFPDITFLRLVRRDINIAGVVFFVKRGKTCNSINRRNELRGYKNNDVGLTEGTGYES